MRFILEIAKLLAKVSSNDKIYMILHTKLRTFYPYGQQTFQHF